MLIQQRAATGPSVEAPFVLLFYGISTRSSARDSMRDLRLSDLTGPWALFIIGPSAAAFPPSQQLTSPSPLPP